MISLYVDGKKVGSWADVEQLFKQTATREPVEFRDENGQIIATTIPADPIVPWEPTLTRAEIERRKAAPGLTFEEVKKVLGWP